MVAAQRHDAITVTFLQVHNEFEDPERIGASVAVITQQDQLGVLGLEVDGGKRRFKGVQASVNVTHSVDMHL